MAAGQFMRDRAQQPAEGLRLLPREAQRGQQGG